MEVLQVHDLTFYAAFVADALRRTDEAAQRLADGHKGGKGKAAAAGKGKGRGKGTGKGNAATGNAGGRGGGR
eukprot:10701920-Heterocapsa_arctica.AAC.2